MKKKIIILVLCLLQISCKAKSNTYEHIIEPEYELFKVNQQKAILVLFPCFPCDIENTKNEFPIIDYATSQGVSVLLMNYNQKLYLNESEFVALSDLFNSIFETQNVKTENVHIGGFSSGGNVSLLWSNYLLKTHNKIVPKGVFIVDSPVDILGLYYVAKKNISMNISSDSVEESNWIIQKLQSDLGNPNDSINLYEKKAPFTLETKNIGNAKYLKNIKIRFYTEPDIDWWKETKNNEEKDLNSYFIQQFYKELKQGEFKKVSLVLTKNKGYRKNGDRHPHSWSIVDKDNLIKWILDN
ncbi:hypothetical protein SY27_01155 [Flavobacterium sp. 316]|uniref:hypothetical protein n=1 Tax=Flavobacterium sp. 316 TaxID=1603293 RepID=UPI0005DC0D73|nr:hypothetical protein [Flavobacterium sp. 316]KIX22484.1 hypothetical protein SY27_01155 [Flavobacterium sp. 316]